MRWNAGFTRKNCTTVAAVLFAVSLCLPAAFFEYRAERLHCGQTPEGYDCVAGDIPGALVIPLGLDIRPPDIAHVRGIYVRKGYANSVGRRGGFWLPLTLFCAGIYFIARSKRHTGAAEREMTALKVARIGLAASLAVFAASMLTLYIIPNPLLVWPIILSLGGIALTAVAWVGIPLAGSVRKLMRANSDTAPS